MRAVQQWTMNSEAWLFFIMVVALQIIALPANMASSDPDTLVAKSLDEEAFRVVLYEIHAGIEAGDFEQMAPAIFLAYGWTFFFVNAFSTYWFSDTPTWVITIPRLISTLAGTISLWFVYKIARQFITRPQAMLLATLVLFLPDFYANAFWIHPEHPVVAPLVATLYFLMKDRSQLRKNFYYALACLGVALTMKLTALLFYAVPVGYVIYVLVWRRQLPWKQYLWAALGIVGVPVITVALLNPSVFIDGRVTMIREFLKITMQSYAQNTAALTPQILWNGTISPNYMTFGVTLLFLGLGIIGSIIELRKRSTQPVVLLATLWSFGFLYYTIARVGGHLAHYYLPVFTFVPVLAITLKYLFNKQHYITAGLGLLLVVQVITQWSNVIDKFVQDIAGTKSRDLSMTEELVFDNRIVARHAADLLKEKNIEPTSVLVSAFLPFPAGEFPTLTGSLPRIYGYLSEGQMGSYGYPDIVVLSKQEFYFYDLSDPTITNRFDYPDIQSAHLFIDNLKLGQLLNNGLTYQVIADDNIVLMLQKQTVQP